MSRAASAIREGFQHAHDKAGLVERFASQKNHHEDTKDTKDTKEILKERRIS